MSERPKVSFVCSVKDGARDLERCAGSVLNQTMREVELILVDDHSSDTTWNLMESLAKGDPRVRAVRNYGKGGLTYSLNMGLDFARGDFVARIDVDDFAHADRADKQVAALESDDRAVMAASCYRLVDEDDWMLYSHCPPGDPVMLKWSLCFRNYIRHSTVMWRRSYDFRYEPAFPYAQDYELWCRMSRVGDIRVLHETLTTIRSRRDSITNTRYEEQEAAADRVAAEQWEYYVGRPMGRRAARCLRLVQHMKSGDQFADMSRVDKEEFVRAIADYCTLAAAFREKEGADRESLFREIGYDIDTLLNNPERRDHAVEGLRTAEGELGTEGFAGEMLGRFPR